MEEPVSYCDLPDGPLEVDNDIVGWGNVVAFCFTVFICISTVVFGYLSDSLDDALMSDLDRDIIRSFQKRLRKLTKRTEDVEPQLADQKRIVRKEAISRFIMMLSDQQLVTGLAILISSLSNQGKITGYEFSMVCGLSLLAFTTHVSTLAATRPDFSPRDPIANLRILLMTAMVVLLIYALSLDLFTYTALPVQCVFEGVYWPTDRLQLAANIAFFVLLARVYYTTVYPIYFRRRASVHVAHWLRTIFNIRSRHGVRFESRGPSSYVHLNEYESAHYTEELQRIQRCRSPSTRWLLTGIFRYRSDGSFLQRMPDIVLTIMSGLSVIIYTRSRSDVVLASDASDMGYGQMMALLLLALQLLSGAETYRSYVGELSKLQYSYRSASTATRDKDISDFGLEEYRVLTGVVGTFTVLAPVFITSGDNYKNQFAMVCKYFSREVREIGSFSEEAMPGGTVERMRSLTAQAEELDALVSHMGLSGSAAIFLLDVCWLGVTGILTSVDTLYAAWILLTMVILMVLGDLERLIILVNPSIQHANVRQTKFAFSASEAVIAPFASLVTLALGRLDTGND